MAGQSGHADQPIASCNSTKNELIIQEQAERTIDCVDAKRRFDKLPINRSGWTVETGWASDML